MDRAIAAAATAPADLERRQRATRQAIAEINADLERLTAAVLSGGEASTLVHAMKERERRRETLQRELADLEAPRAAARSGRRLAENLTTKLGEWRGLQRAYAPQARQMLRKLIEGRIVFTPKTETRSYAFVATGRLSRFFNGLVHPQAVASQRQPRRVSATRACAAILT
jgi:chromosome segregation ATPase